MEFEDLIGKVYKMGKEGAYLKIIAITKVAEGFYTKRLNLETKEVTAMILDDHILKAIRKYNIVDNHLMGILYGR